MMNILQRIPKTLILLVVLLLIAGGLLGYIKFRTPFAPVVSKASSSLSVGDIKINAQVISNISELYIKNINTTLLGDVLEEFKLGEKKVLHVIDTNEDVEVKQITFSFLPIELASGLQKRQKTETVTGPDGEIRIINSTYNKQDQEVNFKIYYKKSYLDKIKSDQLATELTSASFRALFFASDPSIFSRSNENYQKMYVDLVGNQKIFEVSK